jgi:glucose/arabinose dehydrogenase
MNAHFRHLAREVKPMFRKLIFLSLILLTAALMLTACGAPPSLSQNAPASAPTHAPTQIPKPTEEPETIMSETKPTAQATLSPEMQSVADEAATVLTKTLNVSPEDVTILEIQRVEWRDASLGCPKPGMMYAQVITPGYLVKAEVNGEEQMVHMNEKGHGVVCPADQAKSPISPAD